MSNIRAAAGRAVRRAFACVSGRVAAASSARRRSAEKFLLVVFIVALTGCSSAIALDFREYKACREQLGTQMHDPGTVIGEYLGDERPEPKRHYRFLADRHKNDERQILDVTRVNRFCPLVTGVAAGGIPVGEVWDLSGDRGSTRRHR